MYIFTLPPHPPPLLTTGPPGVAPPSKESEEHYTPFRRSAASSEVHSRGLHSERTPQGRLSFASDRDELQEYRPGSSDRTLQGLSLHSDRFSDERTPQRGTCASPGDRTVGTPDGKEPEQGNAAERGSGERRVHTRVAGVHIGTPGVHTGASSETGRFSTPLSPAKAFEAALAEVMAAEGQEEGEEGSHQGQQESQQESQQEGQQQGPKEEGQPGKEGHQESQQEGQQQGEQEIIISLPPRDTFPRHDSAGTAHSGKQPPAQPLSPPQTGGAQSHSQHASREGAQEGQTEGVVEGLAVPRDATPGGAVPGGEALGEEASGGGASGGHAEQRGRGEVWGSTPWEKAHGGQEEKRKRRRQLDFTAVADAGRSPRARGLAPGDAALSSTSILAPANANAGCAPLSPSTGDSASRCLLHNTDGGCSSPFSPNTGGGGALNTGGGAFASFSLNAGGRTSAPASPNTGGGILDVQMLRLSRIDWSAVALAGAALSPASPPSV